MDPRRAEALQQAALDEYNYDETYALQPAEVAAMAVTMRRFEIFQRRFMQKFEDAGHRSFPPELYVAAAMLAASASITHLEEIIRVPSEPAQPVTAPEAQKENQDGVA
jgi:hypothetical protein